MVAEQRDAFEPCVVRQVSHVHVAKHLVQAGFLVCVAHMHNFTSACRQFRKRSQRFGERGGASRAPRGRVVLAAYLRIALSMEPMPSIVTFITSPRLTATWSNPGGAPVEIRSPGLSVTTLLTHSMIS